MHKKIPALESPPNNIAGLQPATSSKIDSDTDVFLRVLQYF